MKDKSVVKVSMQAPLRSITIKNVDPLNYHLIKDYLVFEKKRIKENNKNAGIVGVDITNNDILLSIILDSIDSKAIVNKKFASEFIKFREEKRNRILQKKLYEEEKDV